MGTNHNVPGTAVPGIQYSCGAAHEDRAPAQPNPNPFNNTHFRMRLSCSASSASDSEFRGSQASCHTIRSCVTPKYGRSVQAAADPLLGLHLQGHEPSSAHSPGLLPVQGPRPIAALGGLGACSASSTCSILCLHVHPILHASASFHWPDWWWWRWWWLWSLRERGWPAHEARPTPCQRRKLSLGGWNQSRKWGLVQANTLSLCE